MNMLESLQLIGLTTTGSYGSLPIPVLEKCEKLSREIEANPDRFMRSTSKPLLTTVRARVASLIGAQADECVIVPNATHGINTVLRNLEWHEGDIVVRSELHISGSARVKATDAKVSKLILHFQLP